MLCPRCGDELRHGDVSFGICWRCGWLLEDGTPFPSPTQVDPVLDEPAWMKEEDDETSAATADSARTVRRTDRCAPHRENGRGADRLVTGGDMPDGTALTASGAVAS